MQVAISIDRIYTMAGPKMKYTHGIMKTDLYLGYLLAKKAELQSSINNLDIAAQIRDLIEIERTS
jgi:hypothetical protein